MFIALIPFCSSVLKFRLKSVHGILNISDFLFSVVAKNSASMYNSNSSLYSGDSGDNIWLRPSNQRSISVSSASSLHETVYTRVWKVCNTRYILLGTHGQ